MCDLKQISGCSTPVSAFSLSCIKAVVYMNKAPNPTSFPAWAEVICWGWGGCESARARCALQGSWQEMTLYISGDIGCQSVNGFCHEWITTTNVRWREEESFTCLSLFISHDPHFRFQMRGGSGWVLVAGRLLLWACWNKRVPRWEKMRERGPFVFTIKEQENSNSRCILVSAASINGICPVCVSFILVNSHLRLVPSECLNTIVWESRANFPPTGCSETRKMQPEKSKALLELTLTHLVSQS